jgi:hypothetical protein
MILPFCLGLLNVAVVVYGRKMRMRWWETAVNVVSAIVCIGLSVLVWSRP